MHYSFTPRPSELRPGDRFMVRRLAKGFVETDDLEILETISNGPDGLRAVGPDGTEYHVPEHRTSPTGGAWNFFWTLPMPDVEEERAFEFCRAVARQGSWHRQPPLVLVGEVREDGHAIGRLVFAAPETRIAPVEGEDCDQTDTRPEPICEGGPWTLGEPLLLSLEGLPEDLRSGDLVCGTDFSCHYDPAMRGCRSPI